MKSILIKIKNKEEWVSVLKYLFSKGYIWAGGSGTKLRFSYYNGHKTVFLKFQPAYKESIIYGHSLDFQEGELYNADKFLKDWKNEKI